MDIILFLHYHFNKNFKLQQVEQNALECSGYCTTQSDEKCIEMLKQSKEAMSGQGMVVKLTMIDMVVGNHNPLKHNSSLTWGSW